MTLDGSSEMRIETLVRNRRISGMNLQDFGAAPWPVDDDDNFRWQFCRMLEIIGICASIKALSRRKA